MIAIVPAIVVVKAMVIATEIETAFVIVSSICSRRRRSRCRRSSTCYMPEGRDSGLTEDGAIAFSAKFLAGCQPEESLRKLVVFCPTVYRNLSNCSQSIIMYLT